MHYCEATDNMTSLDPSNSEDGTGSEKFESMARKLIHELEEAARRPKMVFVTSPQLSGKGRKQNRKSNEKAETAEHPHSLCIELSEEAAVTDKDGVKDKAVLLDHCVPASDDVPNDSAAPTLSKVIDEQTDGIFRIKSCEDDNLSSETYTSKPANGFGAKKIVFVTPSRNSSSALVTLPGRGKASPSTMEATESGYLVTAEEAWDLSPITEHVGVEAGGSYNTPVKTKGRFRRKSESELDLSPGSPGALTLATHDSSIEFDYTDDEEEETNFAIRRRRWFLGLCILFVLIIGLVIGLVLEFRSEDGKSGDSNTASNPTEPNKPPPAPMQPTGERLCNGLASNCHMRANEIMYATVNEAMSSEQFGFDPFHNLESLEDALDSGFRGFKISSCFCADKDAIQLCGASCTEGSRPAVPVFRSLVRFLLLNPNEVILLNIEVNDDTLMGLFENAFSEVVGLRSFMYAHPSVKTPWPLLSELVDTNKRLIVFQNGGPNCFIPGDCPIGVHNTYAYMFSTPSESDGLEELEDYIESCRVSRGSPVKASFFISNHFALDSFGLPNPNLASQANNEASLRNRLDACQASLEHVVNMLVVDFWSVGDTLKVVEDYNTAMGSNKSGFV